MRLLVWLKHFKLLLLSFGGGGGSGVKTSPIDVWKNLKTAFLDQLAFFHTEIVFFCAVSNCLYNSRNLHCNAIIPVIKLFWCVALEPMAGSKCKPGQGLWALKLESCCDVIKTLFSTAMAGQDSVSAQKAFLEENGCNACR